MTVQRVDQSAQVVVADRGIGIKGDGSTLFEAFYRENEAGQYTSGMGIGLTVCKRLVEAMGGEIQAAPREGGGALFSFTLRLVTS